MKLDPDTVSLLRDFSIIFLGALAFVWSSWNTFLVFRPKIIPWYVMLLTWLLSDHIAKEAALHEKIEKRIDHLEEIL
jgi:hypothetical protein